MADEIWNVYGPGKTGVVFSRATTSEVLEFLKQQTDHAPDDFYIRKLVPAQSFKEVETSIIFGFDFIKENITKV